MTNSANVNASTHYTNLFKSWGKPYGAKPDAASLDTVHKLGARPGKQALAIAMGMRDSGVTGSQIIMACSAPQFNKMRGFITDGLLKREPASKTDEGHTVYKLTLTAKGKQRVERTEKALAKAAEAAAAEPEVQAKPVKKAAAKPRKPKATVTAEPATVITEPQAEQPAA